MRITTSLRKKNSNHTISITLTRQAKILENTIKSIAGSITKVKIYDDPLTDSSDITIDLLSENVVRLKSLNLTLEVDTNSLPTVLLLLVNNIINTKRISRLKRKLKSTKKLLRDITSVDFSISRERNITSLLRHILITFLKLTNSDSGSIAIIENNQVLTDADIEYIKQGNQLPNKKLYYVLSHSFSKPINLESLKILVNNKSISGYAILTGKPLIVNDAYNLPPELPFSFNPEVDRKMGYQTRSIMVVPMKNYKGHILGVVTLVNRKKHYSIKLDFTKDVSEYVYPYDDNLASLAEYLAYQAGIAIENLYLIHKMEKMFEGFIRASIQTIDRRDPSTSGHSERVAALSYNLALAVNETTTGPYAKLRFSQTELEEIKYAALLHDFGKILVPEHILQKSTRLPIPHFQALIEKLTILKLKIISSILADTNLPLDELQSQIIDKVSWLYEVNTRLLEINQPIPLSDEDINFVNNLANIKIPDLFDNERSLLNEYELEALTIRKGTLTQKERKIVEQHVTYSYEFLKQVPWPEGFENVPEYAYAHHEKLDGSGYPRGLKGDEIPIQSRIIAIADFFDALAATDRPYKKAVPIPKILDILKKEGENNKLDKELVRIFIDEKVYATYDKV